MPEDINREKQIEAQTQAAEGAHSASSPLVSALQNGNFEWAREITQAFGEVTVIMPRAFVAEACQFLKTTVGFEFNMLSDITGVDRGAEEEPRFEVNYQLFSTTKYHRLRLKVLLNEDDTRVPSVTGVWRTANWHERETFDMFGIIFDGHPDLRRILLPDDWQGHALRKDFPLRGYEPYSLN